MSEAKDKQGNIGRASTMVSCLPFLSLGFQVVWEAKTADVLEIKRHETQSVSTPQGVDGNASRAEAFERDGGDDMTVQELRAQIAPRSGRCSSQRPIGLH